MSRAGTLITADRPPLSAQRAPRSCRGDGWGALADIEVFVFAVEAELEAMDRERVGVHRRGRKPDFTLRRRLIGLIWTLTFAGLQWRSAGWLSGVQAPGPTGSRVRQSANRATNAGRLRGDGDPQKGPGSDHSRGRYARSGRLCRDPEQARDKDGLIWTRIWVRLREATRDQVGQCRVELVGRHPKPTGSYFGRNIPRINLETQGTSPSAPGRPSHRCAGVSLSRDAGAEGFRELA